MTLTCLACGHTGPEVAMTIVEVPPGEQRVVSVPLVSAEERGQIRGFDYVEAREHFAHEPRCPDYNAKPGQPSACQARRQSVEPAAPPPPDADPDPLPAFLRGGAEPPSPSSRR